MRRRRIFFTTLLALAALGGVVWLLMPSEPRYQGKGLNEWLRSFDQAPLEWNSDLTLPTNEACTGLRPDRPRGRAFSYSGVGRP
jgi:hypothetical protein